MFVSLQEQGILVQIGTRRKSNWTIRKSNMEVTQYEDKLDEIQMNNAKIVACLSK